MKSFFDLFTLSVWSLGIAALECPPNIAYYSLYSHSNSHLDALCSLKSFKGMHAATGNETNGLPVPRMTKNGMNNCQLRDFDILIYELWSKSHLDSNIDKE